jgi:hypothetical protein
MRTAQGTWPLQMAEDTSSGGGGDDTQAGGGGDDNLGTVEERARRMGWVPEAEFKGDKSRWVDAQTFVKNGEEALPILRERMRTLERTNAELLKTVTEAKKFNETVYQRAYDKAKKDLEAQIRAAAKAGDEEAATQAADDLAKLEREKAERDAGGDEDPVFDAWIAQNRWYSDDPDLALEAEAEAFKLRKRGEKAEGVAFLEKVKEAVKKRFPEKFGNPRRTAPGQVEGAAPGGDGGSRGKKGWESLPREAKEAGERFIKQGIVKDKATYAQQYWDQFAEA